LWVPYVIENKKDPERVKAEQDTIEHLIGRENLINLIRDNIEKAAKFLPHLGFDRLDLEIIRLSVEQNKSEEEVKSEIIEIIDKIPYLSDISKYSSDKIEDLMSKFNEWNEIENIREENKRVGSNVEKIVEKILSDKGLNVRPTFIGGDLEIWPSEENGYDGGCIEIQPYIIEIKFTSGSRVHLSKKQSDKARDKRENYFVLVVENADNLRNSLDVDENLITDDIINLVITNSHMIEEIYTRLSVNPNTDEIEPDIHGYWIKKRLWENSDNISDWIQKRFGNINT
jgi:hypothetical protein